MLFNTEMEMEMATMTPSTIYMASSTSSSKFLEEREEILDRIFDIIKTIKKLNMALTTDYLTITDQLKNNFNKMNAFHLIETMKQDSQLRMIPTLSYKIQNYYGDIMKQLNYVMV